jgi:hypothetical protein
MQSVYYIIPTTGIGGAEKRFIELWCYLQQHENQFNFKLVITEQLEAALKAIPEIEQKLQPWKKNITIYKNERSESVLRSQQELYRFVCKQTSSNDILHFILSFPTFIFPLKHKKTIYSLTESSLFNVNIKGRIIYLFNVLRASYTDILDPLVYKKISQYFFFRKNRIMLTPGSFVDTNVFKPADGHHKENWFVFLGRFFFCEAGYRTFPVSSRGLQKAG